MILNVLPGVHIIGRVRAFSSSPQWVSARNFGDRSLTAGWCQGGKGKGKVLHIKREECGVFGGKKNRETIQKGGEGEIEMGKNKDIGLHLR